MSNADQKQSILQRFHQASVEDIQVSDTAGSGTVDKTIEFMSDSGSRSSSELSVSVEDATNMTGLPILF